MKLPALVVAFSLLWSVTGCGHLDVTPQGNPDRVLSGSVRAPSALPAGTEVVVRLIAPSPMESPAGMTKQELPLADRVRPPMADRPLGEHRQVLAAGTLEPVPYRIEYHADDDVLRRGVNVDVRISYGGRVRFRTITAHVVTLASSPFPQEVAVQPVQ